MRWHFLRALAGALTLTIAASAANAGDRSTIADPGFRAFLAEFEEGTRRFLNGDGRMWKDNASKRDDVMIMGAWGAYEKGWPEVSKRYDWAAARFVDSGATLEVEYLSSEISGDLAFTKAIERAKVRLVDQSETRPMALRVTHIFRKEEGAWKLVSRHADPLMQKTEPAEALAK